MGNFYNTLSSVPALIVKEFVMRVAGDDVNIVIVNELIYEVFVRQPIGSPVVFMDEQLIVIGEDFWHQCPINHMRAVVWHEVGHLVHNHHGMFRVFEHEVEADMMAAKKMGVQAALDMLQWLAKDYLQDRMGLSKYHMAIKELRERYRAVKRLSNYYKWK